MVATLLFFCFFFCFKVIESLRELNMSANGVFDLSFLSAFVGLQSLNLNDNRISSKRELDYIAALKNVKMIQLKGI